MERAAEAAPFMSASVCAVEYLRNRKGNEGREWKVGQTADGKRRNGKAGARTGRQLTKRSLQQTRIERCRCAGRIHTLGEG